MQGCAFKIMIRTAVNCAQSICACSCLPATLCVTAVLMDIITSLQSIGIGVTQYHPEAAPGQFEVVLSACECAQDGRGTGYHLAQSVQQTKGCMQRCQPHQHRGSNAVQ